MDPLMIEKWMKAALYAAIVLSGSSPGVGSKPVGTAISATAGAHVSGKAVSRSESRYTRRQDLLAEPEHTRLPEAYEPEEDYMDAMLRDTRGP